MYSLYKADKIQTTVAEFNVFQSLFIQFLANQTDTTNFDQFKHFFNTLALF